MDNIISENIIKIKENIALAAARAGRSPTEITLVAATKMNDASRVQEAIRAGITVCGENRVQEMLEKNALGAYTGSHLHFIGHLQKNKAKQVTGLVELIHSVDSIELLETISRIAGSRGIVQDVLLEVNIGNEPTKSGFSPDSLRCALDNIAALSGISVRGLMAIPPVCTEEGKNLPYFMSMRQLFVDIGEKKYDNINMDILSLGMSQDYMSAIEAGSNMVRIGTGIFGPRNYGITP